MRLLATCFLALLALTIVRSPASGGETGHFAGPPIDLAAGPDGSVWVIAERPADATSTAGVDFWRRDPNGTWALAGRDLVPDARQLAVDPLGLVWIVNGRGVFRYDGERVVQVSPTGSSDIAVGSDWSVWIVGPDPAPGGLAIRRSPDSGATWEPFPGGATAIAGDPHGMPWIVDSRHVASRFDGTSFVALAGPVGNARDVSVSASGGVWISNESGLHHTEDNGASWRSPWAGNDFSRITATPDNTPCVATAGGAGHVECFGPEPFVITLSGVEIIPVMPKTPTSRPACSPIDGKVHDSTSLVEGVLVQCAAPDEARPPLAVTGLPSIFTPQVAVPGTYLCPIIGTGARLKKSCQDPFDKALQAKTNGKATYLGKAAADPLKACAAYGRVAGLGYAFPDPRNGGECWACPVLMHRTFFAVTSTDPSFPACTTGADDGIMWQSAQYPEPGVAAFLGNGDILRLAFLDRARVDAFLSRRAGGDPAKKQALWNQMAEAPNDSPELKALLYATLLAVAKDDPDLRTNVAQQSLSIFSTYIQQRRTYAATEALRMYDRYLDLNAYKQWVGAGAVMAAGGPLGVVGAGSGTVITSPGALLSRLVGIAPDDYVNAAYAATVPDARGQAVIAAIADLAATPYTSSTGTTGEDPMKWISLGLSTAASSKAVHDLLGELQIIQGIGALGGKAGLGIDLGMGLAGQLLDAIAAIMTLDAQMSVGDKYLTLVEEAKQPVSVSRIVASGTQDERNDLILWWALATSAHRAGSTVGDAPLGNADVCAAYADRCAMVRQVVTAARPAPTAPAGPPRPRPVHNRHSDDLR